MLTLTTFLFTHLKSNNYRGCTATYLRCGSGPRFLEKTEPSGNLVDHFKESNVKGGQDSPPGQQSNDMASEPKRKSLTNYLSVLLLGVVGSLVALDTNSLAVTLPPIGKELDGTSLETFGPELLGSIVFAVGQNMAIIILGRTLMGLGGGAFVLAFVFLRKREIQMDFRKKLERLDWIGILLFATGGTCIALPLSWANSLFTWSSWQTIVPLVVGVLLLCIMGWYEGKPAEPVFPYRIFATRTANAPILSGAVHGLLMYSVSQYLPMLY
ncbi:hypothetical protein VMCG_06757 [Cytospora schulzeri]|uniref:Major facilitator superfamily (MFS) profile domain-containing protein n=1 Tax=Cytospora schulzeri TaxID=448051 RepID=A0A423W5U8_9PEZI|nr:hypothetical protein VMCG_06757 [Valsa malicola]